MNDNQMSMVRTWEKLFFNERYVATDLTNNPDYVNTTVDELKKVLEDKLHEYNDTKPAMPLVLFLQAM